jgi:uncharacterized protein YndB with AHSA1/START domain
MKRLLLIICTLLPFPGALAAEPLVTEGFINAPLADVWRLFTTADGLVQTGAVRADVELRLGGAIRLQHAAPNGRVDLEAYEILAYEPQRMLALRLTQPPAGVPDKDAMQGLWTVIYFTPSGQDMTHVRIVGLGYTDSPGSQAARAFFERQTRDRLDRIAKPYWPQCELCKREAEAPES